MSYEFEYYYEAYRRLDFKTSYESSKNVMSYEAIKESGNIYGLLEKAYGNLQKFDEHRIIFNAIEIEKEFDRHLLLERILAFLVAYSDITITYIANDKDIMAVDSLAQTMAKSRDIHFEGIVDMFEDDYVILIANPFWYEQIWFDDLSYIKVFSNGTCKFAFYSKYEYSENHEEIITLENSMFDRIMSHAEKEVSLREEVTELLGRLAEDEDAPSYKYGIKAFGQDTGEYVSETHYFKYRTGIKVLDELIEMAAPKLKRPSFAGRPSPYSNRVFAKKMRVLAYYDSLIEDSTLGNNEDDEDIEFLFTCEPRPDGKVKCKKLRDIRIKFAKDNNIPYEFKECTHEGPCPGTCPLCDKEAKDLSILAEELGGDVNDV